MLRPCTRNLEDALEGLVTMPGSSTPTTAVVGVVTTHHTHSGPGNGPGPDPQNSAYGDPFGMQPAEGYARDLLGDERRLVAEIHRRIDQATDNIRAADNKATALLGPLFVVVGLALTMSGWTTAVALGAVLAPAAMLLGLVLLPRTTPRTPLYRSARIAVVELAAAADPAALAMEHDHLARIAQRKFTLLRAALLAMAAAVPACAAVAALTA